MNRWTAIITVCSITVLNFLKYNKVGRCTAFVLRLVDIKNAVNLYTNFTICINYAAHLHYYWNE